MSRLRGGANWCWKRAQMAMSMLTAFSANVYMASLNNVQRLEINTKLRATRENYHILTNFFSEQIMYGYKIIASGNKMITLGYQLGLHEEQETAEFQSGDLLTRLGGLVAQANKIMADGIGGAGAYTVNGARNLLSRNNAMNDYAGTRIWWQSFRSSIVWILVKGCEPFKVTMYLPLVVKAKTRNATKEVYRTDGLTYIGLFTMICTLMVEFRHIKKRMKAKMIRTFKEKLSKKKNRISSGPMSLHGMFTYTTTFALKSWCLLLGKKARIGTSEESVKSLRLFGSPKPKHIGSAHIGGPAGPRTRVNFDTIKVQREHIRKLRKRVTVVSD